jgi:hypothetical protein
MPRIRCHYEDCVFLEEGYCGAAAVEIDPEMGCQTYSRADDAVADEDEWDEDAFDEDEWDEEDEDLYEDEEDEDWEEGEEEDEY